MRRALEILLVLAVVAVIAFLSSKETRPKFVPRRVTVDFDWEHSPAEAVQGIAEQAGMELLPLPELEGFGSLRGTDMLAVQALDSVLWETEWKLIHNQLLLVSREGERYEIPPNSCGLMEYLLEIVPANQVLEVIQPIFPKLKCRPHPTMNGFYANGPKEDMLEIKRLLSKLDVPDLNNPEISWPSIARTIELRTLSASSVSQLLNRHYPDISHQQDGSTVVLAGDPRQIGPALRELRKQDHTAITVAVSLEKLRQAKPDCLLVSDPDSIRVECSDNCEGPLQLTGLRNGDLLDSDYTAVVRNQPEWWIERDGVPYRIELELVE